MLQHDRCRVRRRFEVPWRSSILRSREFRARLCADHHGMRARNACVRHRGRQEQQLLGRRAEERCGVLGRGRNHQRIFTIRQGERELRRWRDQDCVLSFTSDQIKGLERVFALRAGVAGRKIDSANMSLGGGGFAGFCNDDSRKLIIDKLRNAGIATVIASGNSGFVNGVGAPGCIETAITVGSSTKKLPGSPERMSSFSNQGPQVDTLAQGAISVTRRPAALPSPRTGFFPPSSTAMRSWQARPCLRPMWPGPSRP